MQIRNSFKYAFKRSIPIMVGYFPVGIAYGVLMSEIGYDFVWSALSSLFIYAGSLQILMVSFLADKTPLFTVIITSLLLNSRHIFYGISFIDKFKKYGFWKYFLIYGMSDENYSLLCSYDEKEGVNEKWVHIFSASIIWFCWILFSALGAIVGQLITFNTTGIDFALTALFVVILIEQFKASPSKLPGIIGIVLSVLWIFIIDADNFLLPSLLSTIILLISFKSKIMPDKEVR